MNLKKELMNFLQSLDGDELRNLADGSLPEEMAVDAYIASCPTEKMKRPTINDYPQTDARTFKNLDGSVDWKKYAEALEEYADSLSPSPQPSATAEVEAHTSCPICGRSFSAAADCKQPCQHCNDFMSAAKPVAQPSATAKEKSLIDNILLDISIDVQNELLRQCKKVNCDDYQTDNINENTIAVFELNKQKYLARLYAAKPVAEREVPLPWSTKAADYVNLFTKGAVAEREVPEEEKTCHADEILDMGACDNAGQLCKDCRFYY